MRNKRQMFHVQDAYKRQCMVINAFNSGKTIKGLDYSTEPAAVTRRRINGRWVETRRYNGASLADLPPVTDTDLSPALTLSLADARP